MLLYAGTAPIGCPRSEVPQPLRRSLFEQILKRGARIVRPGARRGRSLFFAGHSNLEQFAVVARIFLHDALLHRLHALKPAAGIEIGTLLAGMKLKSTLRALATGRRPLQHCAALRAARDGPRSRQIHRSRTKCVIPFRRAALSFSRRLPRLLIPRFTIAILITRLTVFRHKVLPQACAQYCPPVAAHWASGVKQSRATDQHRLTRILRGNFDNPCEPWPMLYPLQ